MPITKNSIEHKIRQEIARESFLNRLADLTQRSSSFPDVSDLLRFLTTQTLNPMGAVGAATLIMTSKRDLIVQGLYGVHPSQALNLEKVSANSKHPIALALQTTSLINISKSAAMSEIFENGDSFILIPLLRGQEIYGLLLLITRGELILDEFEKTFMKVISHVIATTSLHHLNQESALEAQLSGKSTTPNGVQKSDNLVGLEDLELTQRQKTIARMIANGSTNREIARDLKYSEATIRYETIKLYERLRVRNRSQAASRIRELKIS